MSINWNKIRNPEMKVMFETSLGNAARKYNLGAPVLADVDLIVVSAEMKNTTTYTIAAQPDISRNITVKHTAVVTADTLGTITITGTDVLGQPLSEIITPVDGTTVLGKLAFKTIASAIGAGWVVSSGTDKDTIEIGVGTLLGLPVIIKETADIDLGVVGIALIVPTVAVTVSPAIATSTAISKCTVDLSSGTYDGSKKVHIFIVE